MLKKPKILFITPKYSSSDADLYLTNDLANELSKDGSEVTVVAYGEENIVRDKNKINECIINVKLNVKILKYLVVWPRLFYTMLSFLFKREKFDQVVMFAPLAVMWPAALCIRLLGIKKKTAIIFDIFPVHQVQINSLPKWSEFIAKWMECFLLSAFNDVTAMGENNKLYIEKYYEGSINKGSVRILPLWGGRMQYEEPKSTFNQSVMRFVFGGQIIKGRDIDAMIDFFELLVKSGCSLTLDIFSKGEGFEALKLKYKDFEWLSFNNQIPRKEYIKTLSQFHVGVIVTDRKVDLPTFPSKVIDYSAAGLASYCIVESESDLLGLANDCEIIYINNFDFSVGEIKKSIDFFNRLKVMSADDIFYAGDRLNNFFKVSQAAKRLVE